MPHTNIQTNVAAGCPVAANELALYAINNRNLYHTKTLPYISALQRRVRAGTFDADRSIAGWKTIATAAAKQYGAEYCDRNTDPLQTFNIPTRALAAQILADYYTDHLTGVKR